tara:strand:- start:5702 stop:5833 length:132 start_codon:yes stop_codon:yes gene_type:complete
MDPSDTLPDPELEADWQAAEFEGYSDEDDLRICDEIDKLQSRD